MLPGQGARGRGRGLRLPSLSRSLLLYIFSLSFRVQHTFLRGFREFRASRPAWQPCPERRPVGALSVLCPRRQLVTPLGLCSEGPPAGPAGPGTPRARPCRCLTWSPRATEGSARPSAALSPRALVSRPAAPPRPGHCQLAALPRPRVGRPSGQRRWTPRLHGLNIARTPSSPADPGRVSLLPRLPPGAGAAALGG